MFRNYFKRELSQVFVLRGFTLYIPKYSEVSDRNLILEVMSKYSFATVVTCSDGLPTANHYPFLITSSNDELVLFTHLARSNPQYTELKNVQKCLVIFQGPHLYVSPSYYKDIENVPTWSYVAIHAHCAAEIIEDREGIETLIDKTVRHFEIENKTHWNYKLPAQFKEHLFKAIVGIKMTVVTVEGKFKLSKNRTKMTMNHWFLPLQNDRTMRRRNC